jgi:hypothetical protein
VPDRERQEVYACDCFNLLRRVLVVAALRVSGRTGIRNVWQKVEAYQRKRGQLQQAIEEHRRA